MLTIGAKVVLAEAIKDAERLGDALDIQSEQAHAKGDYAEWRNLHAQAVGLIRLEMRLKRVARRHQ